MNWKEYYKRNISSFEEISHQVRSGDTIAFGFGVCAPSVEMYDAILDRCEELTDVKIIDAYQLRPNRLYNVDFMRRAQGRITYCPIFGGAGIRQIYKANLADFYGNSVFTVGKKIAHTSDVIVHMCTPPNRHGYVNMGLSGFYSLEGITLGRALGRLRLAVAQINEQMPIVLGNNWMHVSQFDYFIEKSESIIEFSRPIPGEKEKIIGDYVAEMINDRDTIQMGIGSIPEAVIAKLEGKQDLGVLSEMFPMALGELVSKGIVTNRYKPLDTGITIASFCLGDRDLYDFVTENPICELHPAYHTNHPARICQHSNMVSVNMALMVDLSGQIASEGLGHRMISGPGGQLDFHYGAWLSNGGKPLTVLTSARKLADGTLSSSIVPELPAGTPVTVTRAMADNIITEYGVARNLRNLSLNKKAAALIEIAHPDFRAELRESLKKNFFPM